MKRRTTILTAIFIGAAVLACLSASAQLVYVKCCVKKDFARYCFGQAMTGPRHPGGHTFDPHACRVIYWTRTPCRYGFGPSPKSVALQEAMCDHSGYPPPDYAPDWMDFVCAEWQDYSVEITESCWGRGLRINSYGSDLTVLYDYDGDGDLDLRDFARFQNEFGLDGNPPFCFQWCMDGPGHPCQRGCEGYDYDDDMDVDLYDWSRYTLECPGMPPC